MTTDTRNPVRTPALTTTPLTTTPLTTLDDRTSS